jgi:hypothetical protein
MDAPAIALHNHRHADLPGAWIDPRDPGVAKPELVDRSIRERLDYLQAEIVTGRLIEGAIGALGRARALVEAMTAVDHERLVVQETKLHCVPLTEGLYKPPADSAFDRNACGSLHPGERVRVLRRGGRGDWLYVHAGYAVGWIRRGALTPRLSRDQLDRLDSETFAVPLHDEVRTRDGHRIRLGTQVPLVETSGAWWRVWIPDADEGLRLAEVAADGLSAGHPSLTRRNVLEVAFSQIGAAYGWGGHQGHRDCSRYLRDLLATFGIQLGRHSGVQARQGAYSVDLEGLTEREKRAEIRRHAEQGLVLLYMPGHIMLYLGEIGGEPHAISSISEWASACPGGPDTIHRIDRVEVTTLDLGRGTERTAFLERLSRLVVFGSAPLADEASVDPVLEPTEPAPGIERPTPAG